jgi:hypothetical protein
MVFAYNTRLNANRSMKKEIANNVVKVTMLKPDFVSSMIQTVRYMLGLIVIRNGIHHGLQEDPKPANAVMMAFISISNIFANNYLAIVNKLNLMELVPLVKMDMNFVMENVYNMSAKITEKLKEKAKSEE